jgi:hypothetical protein
METRHLAPRVGAVVAVLALGLSVLFVGASRSQGVEADGSITLVDASVIAEGAYPMRDEDGERNATFTVTRIAVLDADGNEVGTHTCRCTNATKAQLGWSCTHTIALRDGPFTDRGTIVMVGDFRGYAGEKVAIVGGTGAYTGARGYATASVEDDEFLTTLHLLP